MNDAIVSESIRQFFGGYFHQDWALEAKDWQTSVDNFTVGETSTVLINLAQQIDKLGAAYAEDELEEVMYRDALCSFYPAPLTYHEWLEQVSDRLRQHAAALERGASPKN
ncbi:contact-dependent growth inhibition system immunity protein [Mycolicibacterium mengxianglii]|uniref:contact-dependent growth inhibition system immunity protein n=1 Tax=Mycolicibacterium mengxianglii TaxID=2736649 RepID=UPI0018D04D55|nr:contact-dependent growth inhibition system immunity protein [Mycolicibacterium mengxianglii]